MNYRIFALFTAILLLIGGVAFFILYEDESEKHGDSCTYNIKVLPVEVLRIDTVSENEVDLMLGANLSSYKVDTLSFYVEENRFVSFKEMDSIRVGTQLQYQIKTIREGSCSPYLARTLLKEFKPL